MTHPLHPADQKHADLTHAPTRPASSGRRSASHPETSWETARRIVDASTCLIGDGYIEAHLPIGLTPQPVPVRVSYVSEEDLDIDESLRVSYVAASIATLVIDVVRGRLSAAGLHRFIESSYVTKLVSLSSLIAECQPYIPSKKTNWLCRRMGKLRGVEAPPVSRRVRSIVKTRDVMDITVSMTVDVRRCWSSMKWERQGSRWMCTLCDIG
ncbi:MAG: hypothetical protein Q4G29_00440 [Pseudoscardovia radai]|nr:hypothetical protein [Pseudoscardovia radai]